MIYAALSGAFLMAYTWESALFMLLFGLGTLPMMLGISFMGTLIRSYFKTGFSRYSYAISYVILAVWLVIRGVGLPQNTTSPEKHSSLNDISVCR